MYLYQHIHNYQSLSTIATKCQGIVWLPGQADWEMLHLHRIKQFVFLSSFTQAFSNNCGDLCLVRVGRKSHIHPAVMKFSLDSMTKKILANASASAMEDNLNSIKERLKAIDASEKKLEREIWKLQTSPDKNEVFTLTYFLITMCC